MLGDTISIESVLLVRVAVPLTVPSVVQSPVTIGTSVVGRTILPLIWVHTIALLPEVVQSPLSSALVATCVLPANLAIPAPGDTEVTILAPAGVNAEKFTASVSTVAIVEVMIHDVRGLVVP